jgi:predicted nucleotidyltransferase
VNPKSLDDAVEELRREFSERSLRTAVLFGSAARGEATEESDIDLLLIPSSPGSVRPMLRVIKGVEQVHRVKISVVTSHSPALADLETQLRESIVRQGVVLVGSLPDLGTRALDLEPVRLLTLDLRGLTPTNKVRLERELFGYRSVRRYGRRVYRSRTLGKLEALGGRRIGRAVIVVPERAAPEIDRIVRSHGARRVLVPAWIQRP